MPSERAGTVARCHHPGSKRRGGVGQDTAGYRGFADLKRHFGVLHLTRDADEVARRQTAGRSIAFLRSSCCTAKLLELPDRKIGLKPITDALRLRGLETIAFQRSRDLGRWIDATRNEQNRDTSRDAEGGPYYCSFSHGEAPLSSNSCHAIGIDGLRRHES